MGQMTHQSMLLKNALLNGKAIFIFIFTFHIIVSNNILCGFKEAFSSFVKQVQPSIYYNVHIQYLNCWF